MMHLFTQKQITPGMLEEIKRGIGIAFEEPVAERRRPQLVQDWEPAPDYWGFWKNTPDLDYSRRSVFFLRIDEKIVREGNIDITGQMLDNIGLANVNGRFSTDNRVAITKRYLHGWNLRPTTERTVMYLGGIVPSTNSYNGQWKILDSAQSGEFKLEPLIESNVNKFIREKMAYDLTISLRK